MRETDTTLRRLTQTQLGGLEERCKLPQRGPGQSPGRKRILTHLRLSKPISWQHLSVAALGMFLLICQAKKKSQHFGGFEPVNPPPLNTALRPCVAVAIGSQTSKFERLIHSNYVNLLCASLYKPVFLGFKLTEINNEDSLVAQTPIFGPGKVSKAYNGCSSCSWCCYLFSKNA